MYRVTCDGFPLMDWRDNDLYLIAPKVRLEVNTVCEGSFTIYKQHPNFDKIARMKSVIEVSDETGVLFRGRVTGYSAEFDNGMDVDVEGALAYFNDSVVRPFSFPNDFKNDADYIAAKDSGNVIAFFLGWLIDNHNAQVEDFQKLKLGNVTVTDPNNYIYRYSSGHASTWDTLRSRLFDSSLGGYLCIRYEADGNYIDYLSEFTEINSQEIVYGENLLDLTREADASDIYTAMLPVGADGLTIADLADGDWSADIVKFGDSIYSRKAVAQYGWIYAPVSESTWGDVTLAANLLTKAAERLGGNGVPASFVEATAVDLHFTDAQVESLRIYKNVRVHSAPHGLYEIFPLSKLEIDLNDPRQTKITVGKRVASLSEMTVQLVEKKISTLAEDISKTYSTFDQTDERITAVIIGCLGTDENGEPNNANSLIEAALGKITLSVSSSNGSTTLKLLDGEAELSTKTLRLTVEASNITGKLTIGQLPSSVATKNDIPDISGLVTDDDISDFIKASDLGKSGAVTIDGGRIAADSILSDSLHLGGLLTVYDTKSRSNNTIGGYLGYDSGFNSEYGIGIRACDEAAQVVCTNGASRLSYGISGVVCKEKSVTVDGRSIIQFAVSGTVKADLDSSGFYPASTTMTLGANGYEWADVHAAGTTMSAVIDRIKALEDAMTA